MGISWIGALIALVIAIGLILKKMPVFFGMMIGALIGGLLGFIIWMGLNPDNSFLITQEFDSLEAIKNSDGWSIISTSPLLNGKFLGQKLIHQGWNQIFEVPINAMFEGGKSIIPVILRILASGILIGALIHTRAADAIAHKFANLFGKKLALLSLIITTMILTTAGVFIDIAIICVSPIALKIAKEHKFSKSVTLIALVGGGKTGNLMSPNPNTIAVANAFNTDLIKVMGAGFIIAIIGIIVTFLITYQKNKSDCKHQKAFVTTSFTSDDNQKSLPSVFLSLLGPLVAIIIMTVRPISEIFNVPIVIDPLIALPLGGLVTIFALGYTKETLKIFEKGLKQMIPVSIMLAGTGMLSGIIANSDLSSSLIDLFAKGHLPTWLLAPFSGIIMGFATASTTAGASVASATFASAIGQGVGGAAMTHAGATVLDSMPHGSFFHSTGGAMKMSTKERLKIIIYEAMIGLSLTIASTIIFGVIGLTY